MALYLIDKPKGEIALKMASLDSEAVIVLIQDGVYLDPDAYGKFKEVYAIEHDVVRRGIKEKIKDRARIIDYHELVNIILKHEKIINFA